MQSLFIVNVIAKKPAPNGLIQDVKEQHLVQAYTYGEVERRMAEEFDGVEHKVDSISKKAKVAGAYDGVGQYFFELGIQFDLEEEKTRKETIYVRADTVTSAVIFAEGDHLKDSIWDWAVVSVKRTPILEYHEGKSKQGDLFRESMQNIVDSPDTGVSSVTISSGGEVLGKIERKAS